MAITYTNRKGKTYYLHEGVTKKGKPRYYFSLKDEGQRRGPEWKRCVTIEANRRTANAHKCTGSVSGSLEQNRPQNH